MASISSQTVVLLGSATCLPIFMQLTEEHNARSSASSGRYAMNMHNATCPQTSKLPSQVAFLTVSSYFVTGNTQSALLH